MAACSYRVCGDVLVPPAETAENDGQNTNIQEVATGSVVMFAEHPGNKRETDYALNEHFLITFLADVLVQERLMGTRFMQPEQHWRGVVWRGLLKH